MSSNKRAREDSNEEDDSGISDFLRNLTANFEGGCFSNMDIIVNTLDDCGQEQIKAHDIILASQSNYFKSIMTSGCKESFEKIVHINVDNKQALQDFRLLIRLSYTGYNLKDIDKDAMIRLIPLADSFEFTSCIRKCANSISDKMSFDDAFMCFNDLPPLFHDNELLRNMMTKAFNILLQSIGGYIHTCFQPDEQMTLKQEDHNLFHFPFLDFPLILKDNIKVLPVNFLEKLMDSPSLQCVSENETYTFILYWLHQSPSIIDDDQRMDYFKRLSRLLRYEHMSGHFIANIVMRCPLMEKSGMLTSIMQRALKYRDIYSYKFQSKNRSCKEKSWNFKMECRLLDFMGIHVMKQTVGIVNGYPLVITLYSIRVDNKISLDVKCQLSMMPYDSNSGNLGDKFDVTFCINNDLRNRTHSEYFIKCNKQSYWHTILDKPWDEELYGTCKISLTMKLLH